MAIKKPETVDIIGNLISQLSTTGQLVSKAVEWINNGDDTYTLPLCRTYWFKVGDYIIDPVSTDKLYLTSVVKDESITVQSFYPPSSNSVGLPDVKYFHGTIINTNNELTNIPKSTNKVPMVYLLEQFEERYFTGDSVLDREVTLRMFFLDEANTNVWTTDEHYENVINRTREILDYFIYQVLFKTKGIGKINEYFTTNRVNFGVYQTEKGTINQVFNDQLSGIELRITIPISKNYVDCYC